MAKPTITNRKIYNDALARCIADAGRGDLWVFAYGSLMIRPGFRPKSTHTARVYGYSRQLAIRSMHYRGTPKRYGLVFGLDIGGSCNGVLLRVSSSHKQKTIKALFRREMFADAYKPCYVQAKVLADGCCVRALTFVSRRDSKHYAPKMPLSDAVPIILSAHGFAGRNVDYVLDAHHELVRRNVTCPQMARLCQMLQFKL